MKRPISNKFKAVIFDLDDTLYDCSGTLIAASRWRASKALVKRGLPLSVKDAFDLQNQLAETYGPHFLVFDEIGRRYNLDEKTLAEAYSAYNTENIDAPIKLFPDAGPTLDELRNMGLKCFLLTVGHHARQMAKIKKLGAENLFDDYLINDYDRGSVLSECLRYLLHKYNLKPAEVLIVGDRPGEEIRHGNELGMATAQILHGRFSIAQPRDEFEEADYKISSLFQVPTIVRLASIAKTPDTLRIVALGGGTGLPVVLKGCKSYCGNLTAIVAVTDSGRSTGVLRREFGMPAPGDLRNCLIALSEPGEKERQLNRLFQYRFHNGSLDGMSLGNLLITAMTEMEDSFEEGVKTMSNLLNIRGKVLPSTVTDAHIGAQLKDGSILKDEVSVGNPNKAPIDRVFLIPEDVKASENAVEEVKNADIIVLGPGSLFTSIIPNLLVQDIKHAIQQSNAVVCYIENIVTQPGETDGFSGYDHFHAVQKYLAPGRIDAVIINSHRPDKKLLEKYAAQGASLVETDPLLEKQDVQVIKCDLCEDFEEPRVLWEKQDLLRHNPDKLGDSICRFFAGLPAR